MAGQAAAAELRSTRLMSDAHKAALAKGREEGRIVRRYLEAVARRDSGEIEALEVEFIKVARPYTERKGLSYSAWRAVGVQPRVLRAAGITRRSA